MAKNRTLLPGIAVSLLLHAGLIALLAAPSRPGPQPDTRRMMVWLTPRAVPPAPAKPAAAAPVIAPVSGPVIASARRPPPVTPERARQPDATAPNAATEQRPAMTVVPAAPPATAPAPASGHATAQAGATADPSLPADPFAPAAAPVQGKFDVNAAMKSARKLATAKSTKDDPPVAQIYDKPLYGPPSDTPLGSAVGRTARADCKSVASGAGILALVILPVMILTDKKDSGCKW